MGAFAWVLPLPDVAEASVVDDNAAYVFVTAYPAEAGLLKEGSRATQRHLQ